jgi:putative flippase GtrA
MIKTIKYLIFAIIATATNIATQYIIFNLFTGEFTIYAAILAGTINGLIVKYILDKRFIFFYKTTTYLDNSKTFFLYSLTGIITTLIFWSKELLFHYMLKYEHAKYIGAIIGLSFGYLIKYFLDRKFVFKEKDAT